MSIHAPKFVSTAIPADAAIAIVAARFNEHLVDKLLSGCEKRLQELGIAADRIYVFRVPGAFELPLVAQSLAQDSKFRAVICLGAVVRGDTPHFDYVASECAAGIRQAAMSTGVPIIFGVLTTDNEQQAHDRLGGSHGHTGERAAEAAAEMIVTIEQIKVKKWLLEN